jgi:glyceraldehyde 3-phosphate dehydrogenase
MIRVAINGFGRIGRNAFKVALEDHSDALEVVAINDLTEPKVLAHLLKYDTAYGPWDREISSDEKNIIIDGKSYPVLAEKEPTALPWGSMNVDVVIESTGRFTKKEEMEKHLQAGAKKVVLSAPAKGDVPTFVLGVNGDKYAGETAVNNASCTTNCISPVASIIHSKFGVKKAMMTTIHSVTAEQNLVDGPPPGGKSNDLRRARAAYGNMIPTTTGAAVATTEAIPELKGLFDGTSIRVPTIVGSLADFTFLLSRPVTVEEVNQAFIEASQSERFNGILAATDEPLVSSDIIGRPESSIVDLSSTQVVDGDMLKVFAWYDNEWGYSNRLVEQVIHVGTYSGGGEQPQQEQTAPADVSSTEPMVPMESQDVSQPMSHEEAPAEQSSSDPFQATLSQAQDALGENNENPLPESAPPTFMPSDDGKETTP